MVACKSLIAIPSMFCFLRAENTGIRFYFHTDYHRLYTHSCSIYLQYTFLIELFVYLSIFMKHASRAVLLGELLSWLKRDFLPSYCNSTHFHCSEHNGATHFPDWNGPIRKSGKTE